MIRLPACSLALLAFLLTAGSLAYAGTLFEDDFESGLGKWTPKPSGSKAYLTVDPTDSSNTVLSFTGTNTAGDLFTKTAIPYADDAELVLRFDYYGATGGGGIVGFNDGTTDGHTPPTWWIAGPIGSTAGYPKVLVADGKWHTYTVRFRVSDFSTATYPEIGLVVEDWGGTGRVHFDNFRLNVVPLPSAAWLGFGLLAVLGAARRLRRRD